jgi:hypothetical protein
MYKSLKAQGGGGGLDDLYRLDSSVAGISFLSLRLNVIIQCLY